MGQNRLNIVTNSDLSFEQPHPTSRSTKIKELQAKFERLWLIAPERFNPLRNCLQRERLERTWQLLTKHVDLINKQTADIGCGAGVFSRRLRDGGMKVEAIDIAENALKHFKKMDADQIRLKRETMPFTHLPDHAYDVLVCTEIIAELPQQDYRLFFAELSRLIKNDGYLICSSDIDIDSTGGVAKLLELAQTEFDILEGVASYHALYLKIKRFFKIPSLFIKGWKNPDFKMKELSTRHGFNYFWFKFNTTSFMIWLWTLCHLFTFPILKMLNNNQKLLLFLEKICRLMWDQEGISHYLFIAKQRPLKTIENKDIPVEHPKRKEIWE